MAGVICIRTSMLRLARSVTCGTLMHQPEPVNVNETDREQTTGSLEGTIVW